MLGSVRALETKIASLIYVPIELKNNMKVSTTGLGGVFITYCSDSRGGVHSLNSNVTFKINFDTSDNYGEYIGDDVGLEMRIYRGIKPMRAIKKKQHYNKVIDKFNKWLMENQEFLISSIQY